MEALRLTSSRPSEIRLPISSDARRARFSIRSRIKEAARPTILARSLIAILDQTFRYVLSAVANALRICSSVCSSKLRSVSPLAGLTLWYAMVVSPKNWFAVFFSSVPNNELEARETAPGGAVAGAEPVENLAGCGVRIAVDDAPRRVDTLHEAPGPVLHHEPLADVVGHHRLRVGVNLEDVDSAAIGRDVPLVRERPRLGFRARNHLFHQLFECLERAVFDCKLVNPGNVSLHRILRHMNLHPMR